MQSNLKLYIVKPITRDLMSISFFDNYDTLLGRIHYRISTTPGIIYSSVSHTDFKGEKIGYNMYLWLFNNPPAGVDKIVSNKADWFNNREIPKIYQRLCKIFPYTERNFCLTFSVR